jgi:uncharacterized membrane protein
MSLSNLLSAIDDIVWGIPLILLIISGGILIAGIIALAAFAFLDFDRLFTIFHSFFFKDGTWTFSADSLLICMLPESFWVALAGIWGLTSVIASIICMLIGSKCTKRARARIRRMKEQAQQAVYCNQPAQSDMPYPPGN